MTFRSVTRIAAIIGIAFLAACQPPSGSVDGWTYGTVTFDDIDAYDISGTSSRVDFAAADQNRGRNLRLIGFRPAATESVNHTACATWGGEDSTVIQPGVAVRTQISNDRRRAITLSNNVYFGARGIWNIHYADSAADIQMKGLGSFDFSAVLGGTTSDQVDPPWRFCLRAHGTTLTAKVWPAGQTEPSWADQRYAKTLTVAADYTFSGRPGWYMGHLSPGETTSLTAL